MRISIFAGRETFLDKGRERGCVKATLAVDAFNVLNEMNYSGFIGNSARFLRASHCGATVTKTAISFRLKF